MRLLHLSFCIICLAACANSGQDGQKTAETTVERKQTPESALGNPSTQKLDNVLSHYLDLKDAFVKSDSVEVAAKSKDLEVAVNGFASGLAGTATPEGVVAHADAMRQVAATLAATKPSATTLEQQRAVFETVSDHLTALLKAAQWKGKTYQQFCPMAFNDKGAHWLSNSDEIRNPYFGDRMLECGEVTDSL